MPRLYGTNPNTPSYNITTDVQSKDSFIKDLSEQVYKLNPNQSNEEQREILEKITKIYSDQLKIIEEREEKQKKYEELLKASLKEQQEHYKQELKSLNVQKEALLTQKDYLEDRKATVGLSENESAALTLVEEKLRNIGKAEEERKKAVVSIAAERIAEHNEIMARYEKEVQKTDRLTKKQQKQLEIEQKKKKLEEDRVKLLEDLNEKQEEALKKATTKEEKESIKQQFAEQEQLINVNFDDALAALSGPVGIAAKAAEKLVKIASAGLTALKKSIDQGLNMASSDFAQYMGRVDSRLQGLNGVNFESFVDNASQWANSSLISQSKYISSIAKLTDSGIAYNLENRALIETIGEKLVSTFETTNATLLRLTRIQQSDLTVSQLGAEAQLTKFLNAMYKDTSYLSDIYDNVTGTLLDAASLMDVNESTSFMFNVQKWLGSLYSLGVSGQGVETIAQGLSYLGTGNVSALSSNSSLQTLIVQSLNKAGYNYADILHNGLDATTTNNLLKAMVENLQSIATNTSSKVLKSAWGSIIGLNTTDLRAITNISSSDIAAISDVTTNYTNAVQEAYNQLSMLSKRTHISEQIDTYINNFMYGAGSALAEDRKNYLTYRGIEATRTFLQQSGVVGKTFDTIFGTIADMGSLALLADSLNSRNQRVVGESKWYSNIPIVGDAIALGSYFKDAFTGGIDLLTNKQKLDMLNWEPTTMRALTWQQYTSRGDILPTVAAELTGVSSGLSYSGSMAQYGTTEAIGNYGDTTFANQEELVSRAYEAISDTSMTVVRDASDIYHELFEAQTTPIRVRLADIEDDAMSKLLLTNGGNYPVDILDSDIDKVSDAIKALQLVRNDYYFD